MSDKALKYDQGKIRYDLLSVPALKATCRVLAKGAEKYTKDGVPGEHNWRKGFEWSRLLRAAIGHLNDFLDGQDLDPETGESHLAHASCCVMFLLEHYHCNLGKDNRYKRTPTENPYVTLNSQETEVSAPDASDLPNCANFPGK